MAILRSYPSMAYNTLETQIPFDIIFDQQLDYLEKYHVIVLANQESLSEKAIERIKEFVKHGGGLVATGNTGMYDARKCR